MVYFDYGQNRYVCSKPTLVPDIRGHLANWRQFRKATSTWPVLSILIFLMRFVIMIAGVIISLWYGVARHGWTKDQYFLISFAVLIPILFLWFLLERVAWNHELRNKGIASNSEVWGVDQFPEKL
jgi:hypothetical protein